MCFTADTISTKLARTPTARVLTALLRQTASTNTGVNELAEIKVKRYRSSRSIKLRVSEDGHVTVTAPPFVSERKINQFVEANQAWLSERLLHVRTKQQHLTAQRDSLPFRGKDYGFRLAISTKKPKVTLDEKILTVQAPTEDDKTVRQILEKWYKKQAKDYFEKRVPLLADLVNHDVRNVTIRSQKTRWGSCSSRQTISLNWRLILCPEWVSDYVIYHELAHLKHMNHSKAFWNLVADYFPKYKEAEKWLKQNRRLLLF